jgi:hypothetical protein
MGRKVTLSVSTLNQWALDFDGNFDRILSSVSKALSILAPFDPWVVGTWASAGFFPGKGRGGQFFSSKAKFLDKK